MVACPWISRNSDGSLSRGVFRKHGNLSHHHPTQKTAVTAPRQSFTGGSLLRSQGWGEEGKAGGGVNAEDWLFCGAITNWVALTNCG